MLTKLEEGLFIRLFDRGGYVLNLSTPDFDAFTLSSVGVALCSKYQQSKARSLNAFIEDSDIATAQKLLFDLFEYYELYYPFDFDDPEVEGYRPLYWDKGNKLTYQRCKEIYEREKSTAQSVTPSMEYIREQFSTEYMNSMIDLLAETRISNPTEAIGKAKELLESCCKTILKAQNEEIDGDWDVPQLSKQTAKLLKVSTDDIDEASPDADIIKRILGGLQGVAGGLAEFRNKYGSGHGKAADFRPLPSRHAKLAVGASVTLVEYYWETYEWRKAQGKLK